VQSGDAADGLSRFEQAIRQGDWNAVARLTKAIASDTIPAAPDEIVQRLRRLERVLIAARVARANLGLSLSRVQAAGRFAHSRTLPTRHEFATPADS
jgi:hypothetical protein